MGQNRAFGVTLALFLAAWNAGCGSAADGSVTACAPAARVAATPEPTPTPTVRKTKVGKTESSRPAGAAKPVADAAVQTATQPRSAGTEDAGSLFAAVAKRLANASSYTATIHVVDNNKFKVKQTKSTLKVTYKAPVAHRIDMVETNNPLTQGGRIIFNLGEGEAKLRPGGILGMAVMTMALSDTKITTGCEWRLDQVVAKSITTRMTGYKADLVGQTVIGGDSLKVLKMTAPGENTLDKDIDYEQVGLDSGNMLRYWAVYAKAGVNVPNGLMWQMTMDDVQLDGSVPDATFTI